MADRKSAVDGLIGSLKRGTDWTAFEARRLARLQSEQSKLARAQAKKKQHIEALGELVWQKFCTGHVDDPEIVAVCRDIQGLLRTISEQEAVMVLIRQEKPPEPPVCSQCGRLLSPADGFCPGCGMRVVAGPAAAAADTGRAQVARVHDGTSICPGCGRAMRSGASFCAGCGTNLAGD